MSVEPNVTSLITWGIAFVGWFAVHKATLSRERRKEKRDAAKQFCLDLRAIERSSLDFHCSELHNPRAAADVLQELERLVMQLLRKPLSELSIPFSLVIQLRRSISRHNFDPSDFRKREPNSELVRGIRIAVTDVIETVEERREQYWA